MQFLKLQRTNSLNQLWPGRQTPAGLCTRLRFDHLRCTVLYSTEERSAQQLIVLLMPQNTELSSKNYLGLNIWMRFWQELRKKNIDIEHSTVVVDVAALALLDSTVAIGAPCPIASMKKLLNTFSLWTWVKIYVSMLVPDQNWHGHLSMTWEHLSLTFSLKGFWILDEHSLQIPNLCQNE